MFTKKTTAASAALLLLATVGVQAQDKPQCRTFREIYGNGKALCENMWNGAFKYEADDSKAYRMHFYDSTNPNAAITDTLAASNPTLFDGDHPDATNDGEYNDDKCHLEYFHKKTPTPEQYLTVCSAWRSSACCDAQTVKDKETIMKNYGPEYHWDRCGLLSPQCEAFFMHEACFYECDPAAGLWRKHPKHVYDTNDEGVVTIGNESDHNAWQIEGMPIQASFCDNWYAACQDDKFCASDGGDFFSCAMEYKAVDESSSGMKPHVIASIVVPVVVALLALLCVVVMIRKERANQPMFSPVDSQVDPDRASA